jgi:hypothetical protein
LKTDIDPHRLLLEAQVKIKKNRNIYSRLIIAVGLIVVLTLSLIFSWRVEQGKTGICMDKGNYGRLFYKT